MDFVVVDTDGDILPLYDIDKPKLRPGPKNNFIQISMYCTACGIFCPNYMEFEEHIFANPSHQMLKCYLCDKTFPDWLKRQEHGIAVHGDQTYCEAANKNVETLYCQFCGESHVDGNVHLQHIAEQHKRVHIRCHFCRYVYKNPSILFCHVAVHSLTNNVDLTCPQCDLHFYEPLVFRDHMTQIHKKNHSDFSYNCVLCPITLHNPDDFKMHVYKHRTFITSEPTGDVTMVKNERPVVNAHGKQCLVCARILTDKSVAEHILQEHFKDDKCSICDIKVTSDMMEAHLKTHISLWSSVQKSKKKRNRKKPITEVATKVVTASPTKPAAAKKARNQKVTKAGVKKPNEQTSFVVKSAKKIGTRECWTCYSLVEIEKFNDHVEGHRKSGTKIFKTPKPKFKKNASDQMKCVKCRICNLMVIKSFLMSHVKIHRDEKGSLAGPSSQKSLSYRRSFSRNEHHSRERYERRRSRSRSPFGRFEESRSLEYYRRSPSLDRPTRYQEDRSLELQVRRRSSSKDQSYLSPERYRSSDYPPERYSPGFLPPPDHPPERYRSPQAAQEIKCTDCSKIFDTVENLINHMKVEHFGVGNQQQQQFPFGNPLLMMAQQRSLMMQHMMNWRFGQPRPFSRTMQPFVPGADPAQAQGPSQ